MPTADRLLAAPATVLRRDRTAPSGARPSLRKLAVRTGIAVATLVLLSAAGLASAHYWTTGRFVESTDDAYVKADSTIIAPKVSGYVVALLVQDNQAVKAGQVLARIDERDFRTALDEADANVAAAAASIANLDAQITAQGSIIQQAQAHVAEAQASLSLARRNDARRRQMARVGYGSEEQSDDATTNAAEKAAALTRLQAAYAASRQQIGVLTSQRTLAQAQLSRTRALKRQAELNLSYSALVAPIDGVVGARTVRVGDYVQAGTQLMALVPLQQVYVVANFKETQLTRVEPDQPARVRVDTFPGHDIEGHVQSVAPASGLEFSLLPPDNATGNFTKIVQRIPIKIALPHSSFLAGQLRPGMSVTVSIDTKTARRERS
ncbi:MAG: HlyD family secretion protein [Gammaproteobacteria bacterium]|nr:HlyD family secretion protein [Gammaproteobacteria bacterium]